MTSPDKRKTHGLSRDPIYKYWENMCRIAKQKNIPIDPAWVGAEGFETFTYQIDKIRPNPLPQWAKLRRIKAGTHPFTLDNMAYRAAKKSKGVLVNAPVTLPQDKIDSAFAAGAASYKSGEAAINNPYASEPILTASWFKGYEHQKTSSKFLPLSIVKK